MKFLTILISFFVISANNISFSQNENFENYISKRTKSDFQKAWKENEKEDAYGFNKITFARQMGKFYEKVISNHVDNPTLESLFQISLESIKLYLYDLNIETTKSRLLIYSGLKLIGTYPLPNTLEEKDMYYSYGRIFATAIEHSKKYSKELKTANNEKLLYYTGNYILKFLDGNSEYIHSSMTDDVEKTQQTSAYTYGFSYRKIEQGIQLTNIFMNPSLLSQGISNGDVIVGINNIKIKDLGEKDINDMLDENKIKNSKFSIYSQKTRLLKEIYATNYKIKLNETQKEFIDGILTIHINSLHHGVADEVFEVVNEYKDKNETKGIILDLRGNIYGEQDETLKLIDIFISEGIIGVFQGKSDNKKSTRIIKNDSQTTKNLYIGDIPLILLIDRSVSGNAEMFALSLSASAKGLLVGESTTGNGKIYKNIELENKSVVKLPIQKYIYQDKQLDRVGNIPLVCNYDIASNDDVDLFIKSIQDNKYTPYEGALWFNRNDKNLLNKVDALKKGCLYKYDSNYEVDSKLAEEIIKNQEVYDYLIEVIYKKISEYK